MQFVPRQLALELRSAVRSFPALILTGPRRAGKTTLLRHEFPEAEYFLLEDPDLIARFRADPRSFVESLRPPAILDEIQHVPEVLGYLRTLIDRDPELPGRWLLTGSQEAPLMQGVTESMAGRAAVFELLPFSREETEKISLLSGGYPEALARPSARRTWFRSYVQTYLERDVRTVSAIRDLATFRRFLALVASRCGQMLNRTDIAAPLGVSVPTVSAWLSILEVTSQILLVPPFYENFGKRIVKSPKLYILDSGLACHLLGIESEEALQRSPFYGPIFEGAVAAEIVKHQVNTGHRRGLYYFRDRQGLEVDFIVDHGDLRLSLLEAKATRSPSPADAGNLLRLSRAVERYDVRQFVVHRSARHGPEAGALRPGVRALPLPRLRELWAPAESDTGEADASEGARQPGSPRS
jgi:predicted AAA+ superfamily ATPase